ncbi:uncharacterized protein METZ01_LOCUS217774 [marine metagenome]|uniref:Uncharacterized protein n=1 Tax=marine metagenome TaxID=408172 RepID=A0A382FPG3_9ZZZZ
MCADNGGNPDSKLWVSMPLLFAFGYVVELFYGWNAVSY